MVLTKPQKGTFAWLSGKGKVLMYTYVNKKLLNMFANYFKQPEIVGHKNSWPVSNLLAAYCSMLGYINQANSYHLHYHWHHHIFKHTHTQFITILSITIVNTWILYCASNKWCLNKQYSYWQFVQQLIEDLTQLGALCSHHKHKHMPVKGCMSVPSPALSTATTTRAEANSDDNINESTSMAATAPSPMKWGCAAWTTHTSNQELPHILTTVTKRSHCIICDKCDCWHICIKCTADAKTNHHIALVYMHDVCYWNHHAGKEQAAAIVEHYSS